MYVHSGASHGDRCSESIYFHVLNVYCNVNVLSLRSFVSLFVLKRDVKNQLTLNSFIA